MSKLFNSDSLMIFPVVVFLNGLCPHIGLKTTQSFAMFSNLRTEGGGSNHLLIPPSWQIWGLHKDLVTIHSSSEPVLQSLSVPSWRGARRNRIFSSQIHLTPYQRAQSSPRWQLPYFVLRRYIHFLAGRGVKDIRLTYQRNGVIKRTENAEADAELTKSSYLSRKFVLPRVTPDIEEGCCMW